jgi:hypothetical protein
MAVRPKIAEGLAAYCDIRLTENCQSHRHRSPAPAPREPVRRRYTKRSAYGFARYFAPIARAARAAIGDFP